MNPLCVRQRQTRRRPSVKRTIERQNFKSRRPGRLIRQTAHLFFLAYLASAPPRVRRAYEYRLHRVFVRARPARHRRRARQPFRRHSHERSRHSIVPSDRWVIPQRRSVRENPHVRFVSHRREHLFVVVSHRQRRDVRVQVQHRVPVRVDDVIPARRVDVDEVSYRTHVRVRAERFHGASRRRSRDGRPHHRGGWFTVRRPRARRRRRRARRRARVARRARNRLARASSRASLERAREHRGRQCGGALFHFFAKSVPTLARARRWPRRRRDDADGWNNLLITRGCARRRLRRRRRRSAVPRGRCRW